MILNVILGKIGHLKRVADRYSCVKSKSYGVISPIVYQVYMRLPCLY